MIKHLEQIASLIPAPIYWLDINHKAIGVNKSFLEIIGIKKVADIIGKSAWDLYPKETAEYIIKHNAEVMKTGNTLSQEEAIRDIITGKLRYFLAIKSPLYADDSDVIIGLIGTSIETTAEKEAEELRIEVERQNAQIQTQQEISKIIDEVNHILQKHKFKVLNRDLGIEENILDHSDKEKITLSKREQEILYYLSLNKVPKEIAQILSIIDNKSVSFKTIQAIIDKHLYPKFGAFSIGQLIEKAHANKLIPFLLPKRTALRQ